MTAVQEIQNAQATELLNEDGESVALELSSGLSDVDVKALEDRVGLPLPEELRMLLGFCSGIEGVLDQVDFTGATLAFEMAEIFPNGLPIAGDGFGNFWVLDITPHAASVAPVFFACHDAPLILHQSDDLAGFLREVFKMNVPPHKSLVDDVHEDRLFQVWKTNPGVISHHDATLSEDGTLKAFAAQLDDRFQFIDLRAATPGLGFSWGRFGPRTEVRRNGHERIFAYAKPEKTGLLAKLFGR